MNHFVYMLKTKDNKICKTYVGYTINLKKRLLSHNINKGAKYTKGRKWKIIYKKKFLNKVDAMKYEYFLKKNRTLRNKIKSYKFND